MRSITIGLSAGVVAFAGIDFALFMLAVWLVPSPAASAFVAEFLLTFAPTVLAGLVAGYLAAPRGFVVAFLAGQRETFGNAFRINPNARFRVLAQVVSGSTVIVREEGTGLVGDMREVGLTLYRVDGDKIAAIWILNGEGAQREKR